MKKCATCEEFKAENEFNWHDKIKGKRWGTCRNCQSEQKKRWYEKNKEKHKANMVENRIKKQAAGRKFIWDYLSTHPCVVCGENDPVVLEFDHNKGKKRASLSRLVRNGHSIEVIQKEINICQVLCANCHRRKTYKDTWRDR